MITQPNPSGIAGEGHDATQRVKKNLLRVDPLNPNTWDRDAAGIGLSRVRA
ncbi:MAG TPA: hypothetical protein VHA79_03310 [Mycobacteriales bacterium]|nr:hypothetical protein [Mycobacteriales bacterium]